MAPSSSPNPRPNSKPRPRGQPKGTKKSSARSTVANTPQLASLDDLPNELALEIIKYVVEDSKRFDSLEALAPLVSLSSINRRFNQLTAPFMYGSYNNSTGKSEEWVRTIVANPDFAKQLKTLRWRYNEYDRTRDQFPIIGCREEINLSVAMTFTPNIEHLHVQDSLRWDCRRSWLHFMSIYQFQHLKSATLILDGTMRLVNITPLFVIPSMRSLEIHGLVEWWVELHCFCPKLEGCTSNKLMDRTSNIEIFRLRAGYIHRHVLQYLMPVFRNLRVFEFHTGQLNSPAFKIAKKTRHPCLLHGFSYHDEYDNAATFATLQESLEYIQYCPFMASVDLSDFKNLRIVDVNCRDLITSGYFGREYPLLSLLPATVEEIRFSHLYELSEYAGVLYDCLEDLGVRGKAELPNLQKVTMEMYRELRTGEMPRWKSIQAMFDKAGLVFDMGLEWYMEAVDGTMLWNGPEPMLTDFHHYETDDSSDHDDDDDDDDDDDSTTASESSDDDGDSTTASREL